VYRLAALIVSGAPTFRLGHDRTQRRNDRVLQQTLCENLAMLEQPQTARQTVGVAY